MITGAVRVAACTAAIGLLAACTSSKPSQVVTLTVSAPNSTSSSASPSTTPPTASPTNSATPPAHLSKLNGTCETLLPHFDVVGAIHLTDVVGTDAFVVGTPEADIGRIGYINCRYGVTGRGASAAPKIEIGISLYATTQRAAARISATVDDYTAHGATATDTVVSGQPATALTGGVGAGYDVPLVVVAFGQRTVAVSIAPAVATGAKATRDAAVLAALALHRTGG